MLREGTENKIRGVEQEYPVSARAGLNPSLLVSAAIQGLRRRRFSRVVKWDTATEISQETHESRISSWFGENGCRIYNDLGHLEISTPSYNSPFDAVAYDKASEIYAFVGSREAGLALKKRVAVHKNNVANTVVNRSGGGSAGGGGSATSTATSTARLSGSGKAGRVKTLTYATHGNFLTKRAACKDWSRVERALIPWVVTRILLTGSGDVVSGDFVGAVGGKRGGVKFVISPRAMFVTRKSSLSTTAGRGILNTRDQPHAARNKYWRLHDIHFEALRSEYAIFLRDILQALVISAFEAGFLDDAPVLEDPVRTFKEISADTQECEWRVRLKGGERTDAVAVLRFYLEKIEEMQEKGSGEGGKWEGEGKKAFEEALEKLEARRVEDFVDGLDWVTKLALLVNYEPKTASEGISVCNQYALLDASVLNCLDLGAGGGRGRGRGRGGSGSLYSQKESLAFAERELPGVGWSSFSERVKYALSNAPENTRDFFRAEILRRFGSHVRSVSWSTLVLNEAKVTLDEPFMLNKAEIGAEMCRGEGEGEGGGEGEGEGEGEGQGRQIEEVLSAAKRLHPDKVIY